MNEKTIKKLRKETMVNINEILETIPDLDVFGVWLVLRKWFNIDDIIIIEDRPYEESKEMVETYLKYVKREVEPFEIIEKFGIDLKIIHRIFTELLKEDKVE